MTKEGKEMQSSIPLPSFLLTSYAHVLRASSMQSLSEFKRKLALLISAGSHKIHIFISVFFILVLVFITCLQTL